MQATVPPTKAKASQRKQDTGVDKEHQSPLSSWIGKQLLGQVIPKKHLDKDGNLQIMENYPHGLLAILSDGYSGQRILVPVDEQKALIKSTHAEIHHQGHTKVHQCSLSPLLLARHGCDNRGSLHSMCKVHSGNEKAKEAQPRLQSVLSKITSSPASKIWH